MPITYERYREVMLANLDKRWELPINPASVGILHGALRLMLMNQRVKTEYTDEFKLAAGHLRNWCLVRFREMGFTEEEVQELDSELS